MPAQGLPPLRGLDRAANVSPGLKPAVLGRRPILECEETGMAGAAKVAIITGAGSGVGRATAQALAKGGFALVLAGRRAEPLEETVRLVAPAQAIAVPTDVSNPASVKALFDKAVEAVRPRSTCSSTTPAPARRPFRWRISPSSSGRRVVDANLTGAFLCTQQAFRAHEGPGAARRPHHQQRLDLGPRAAAELRALHGHQARHHRTDASRPRSTAASTTSPAARSTSATPRPK